MAIPKDVLIQRLSAEYRWGGLGKPEEVAGLVAYLAERRAAFLTGAYCDQRGKHMQ